MLLIADFWPILFSSLAFAGIFIFCLFKIIIALKRGYISYSGNRVSMATNRRYSRKDQPILFWAGIAAFSLPAIALLILALAFMKII